MMKNSIKLQIGKVLMIFMILQFIAYSSWAQEFTIVVFPDTQDEITDKPEMFFSQINWIKDARDSLQIPIVLHVGDLTNDNTYDQWEKVSQGFDVLDRVGIPYALAVGNHDNHTVGGYVDSYPPDNVNALIRITDEFNEYFPASRFTLQRGRFEQGKSDNAYYTFRAGGLDWLVLTLEYLPRRSVINWAQLVLKKYSNHNAIILTHYFLDPDGTISQSTRHGGNLSPETFNQLLVEKFENVRFVLSGHVDSSAYRVGEGVKGNKIYEILQDYQGERFNYGGGYLRLLTINPSTGTISAKIYSPYYDRTLGGSSTFSFSEVEFMRPRK